MSKSPGYSPTSGLMARGASPLNMAQGQNSPAYSPTSMSKYYSFVNNVFKDMRGGTSAYNPMIGASPGRGGISPMPNINSPNIDGRNQMSAGGTSGISPNPHVSP